jgi:hypothetical protein
MKSVSLHSVNMSKPIRFMLRNFVQYAFSLWLLAYFIYFEQMKEAYEITLLSVCLATADSSGSTIPAFRPHVTFHSEAVRRGVSYAARVIPNTQCVMRGQ